VRSEDEHVGGEDELVRGECMCGGECVSVKYIKDAILAEGISIT